MTSSMVPIHAVVPVIITKMKLNIIGEVRSLLFV